MAVGVVTGYVSGGDEVLWWVSETVLRGGKCKSRKVWGYEETKKK